MSKFWSRVARGVDPYAPGEQPRDRQFIKLNTNENPYPPSPKVLAAIAGAADERLRLYPDPNCTDLRAALGARHGLSPEQVYVGNGSDELLAFAFLAFFDPGRAILFPDITYSFYPVWAGLFGVEHRTVPLDEEFRVPVEALLGGNGGVVLANPNAPTGMVLGTDEIRRVLEGNPDALVLVDEAYIDFGGESGIPLVPDYRNLLVVQTYSKSRSLAGLRVGCAYGQAELIEGIARVRNSFNSYTMDRLTLAGALAALEAAGYYDDVCARIAATRERVAPALRSLGFRVLDSKANFLFASHPAHAGADLLQALRERGILVRHFRRPARIADFLRVTVGTDEEMDDLVGALGEMVA